MCLLKILPPVLTLCLVSCETPTLDTRVVKVVSTSREKAVESNIHIKINTLREGIGRKTLHRHAALDRLAREHSDFMMRNAGKFRLSGKKISHFGFQDRSIYARHNFDLQSVSENVAAGSKMKDPSGRFVKAWKESRGHYFNIKGRYQFTGVGVRVAPNGDVFATQLFANKRVNNTWSYGKPDYL